MDDPSKEYYTTTYKHIFIENCQILDPIVPTYYAASVTWLLMAGGFTAYLYMFIPSGSRLSL